MTIHHTQSQNPAQHEEANSQSKTAQNINSFATNHHLLVTSPQGMVQNLNTAPPQIRRQMIKSLQRQNGNRFVQRLVADYQTQSIQRDATGCADCAQHDEDEEPVRRMVDNRRVPIVRRAPAIQRYTVPGALSCMGVVQHINSSSPYRPNWAKTRPRYTFVGTTDDSNETLEDGTVLYHMQGRSANTVTMTVSQDLPEWIASERPNREAEQAAWDTAHSTLQTHENGHSTIAETNRVAMEGDWQGVVIEGSGANLAQARQDAESQLATDKQLWLDQSQAQQEMIDPFSVTVTCPAPPVEDEESAEGEAQSAAEPVAITSVAHADHATA